MANTIDAKGLTCPAPVLLVKDAVERLGQVELTVLVDNEASRENVTRFLGSKGYAVSSVREGEMFRLQAQCEGSVQTDQHISGQLPERETASQKILVSFSLPRIDLVQVMTRSGAS